MRLRAVFLLSVALGSTTAFASDGPPTCNAARIEPKSYALTTRAMAMIVTEPRHDWWDSFDLGKAADDLAHLNDDATRAASKAVEIDPSNLMAHAILARQYLILGEPERAEQAWRRTLDAGGAVVWTATLPDVDGKAYFVVAFDRRAIRIYRFEQFAGEVKRGLGGVPEFPGPDNERFWRAAGGCPDPEVQPDGLVLWSEVKEIKAANWVLSFKLAWTVQVIADAKGKHKDLEEIKIALHGRTGKVELDERVGPKGLVVSNRGPAAYQDLIRRTLVKFVDPQKRIALPPLKPGLGW